MVNAADRDGVLALYSEDAVLIPTFSCETRVSGADIRDYFEGFSGYDNISVIINEDSLECQSITDSIHCLSGKYQWEWSRAGEKTFFKARFTYLIDLCRAAPILHHHSSVVPETG